MALLIQRTQKHGDVLMTRTRTSPEACLENGSFQYQRPAKSIRGKYHDQIRPTGTPPALSMTGHYRYVLSIRINSLHSTTNARGTFQKIRSLRAKKVISCFKEMMATNQRKTRRAHVSEEIMLSVYPSKTSVLGSLWAVYLALCVSRLLHHVTGQSKQRVN